MVKPTKGFLSIASIAALGALAACGTASTGTSSGSTAAGIAGCKGTITVATELPLTGGDATDGPYVQMAAELAVTQANANHLMGGCTLKYESKDDATVLKDGHDPAQGEANITALAVGRNSRRRGRSLQLVGRAGRDPCGVAAITSR